MSDPLTPFGELKNAQGERLDYACAGGAGPQNTGLLVVVCHGVTANKDRAWAMTLTDALTSAGLASLRFSFSGNGESAGDFRESTVTKEVADLGAVLDAVSGRPLCVVGHSMGGAVGVTQAARDPRVGLLVSLAGMVDTHAFCARKFGTLTPGQDLMWEKPECPLSQAFVDDMREIKSVLSLGAQISVPWLLLHGDQDTVVPLTDSQAIADTAPRAELVVLPGADHLFSGADERATAERVVAWVQAQHAL